MEMLGQQRISASRDVVWQALNDPQILKASIPGCEEISRVSDTSMMATAVIKVGPVKAKFKGNLNFTEIDPPNGYRIAGEGQGGIAGFAKGSAIVRLVEDGACTILHYDVSADVGGKLSQLGGRLIDATARQMSVAFFKSFSDQIFIQQNSIGVSSRVPNPRVDDERLLSPEPQTNQQSATRRGWSASLLILCVAIIALWYAFGKELPSLVPVDGQRPHVSADFASSLILLLVASVSYLLGCKASTR